MKPKSEVDLPIGLTLGDPSGIGPECAWPSLKRRSDRVLLIAGEDLLRRLSGPCRPRLPLHRVTDPGSTALKKNHVNYFDPGIVLPRPMTWNDLNVGHPSRTSALISYRCLETAVTLARSGAISALVTGPVSKEGIRSAGIRGFRGQTEYLALRDRARVVCMTFAGECAAVGLASTHLALKQAGAALTRDGMTDRLRLLEEFCGRAYGRPVRTALLALNPHAGEHGLFGQEENRLLVPLVESLKSRGMKIEGPFPADSFWSRRGFWRRFSAILASYHDQGLIPVKAGLLGRTVHITLGLSFLRISADHGTAFDIAGKGEADWTDTDYALKRAEELIRI